MSKQSLLYIDDEPSNLLLFKVLFSDSFDVTTCDSGKAALEILKLNEGNFVYLVTDLSMPEMDGFELLEIVKKNYPNIQRYILTAHLENDKIRHAIQTGLAIKGFRKVMNPEDMIKQILQHL